MRRRSLIDPSQPLHVQQKNIEAGGGQAKVLNEVLRDLTTRTRQPVVGCFSLPKSGRIRKPSVSTNRA